MVTLDEVCEMALALPSTTEVLAWEHERTWRVGGKIFVMGAPGYPTVSLKSTREEQSELVAARPEVFGVAPYVGRYGWVQITLSEIEPGELRELIVEAWRLTAPKKQVREFDAVQGASP
jgi:hypothetical protein